MWEGIHIHFFSESSAGRVSVMAYLTSSNSGRPDTEKCRIKDRIVKKSCVTRLLKLHARDLPRTCES